MLQSLLDAILDEFSTGQTMRDIHQYWLFHSTVPGPGMHQASEFLAQRYREAGLETEIFLYPADDQTEWLGGQKIGMAWQARSARLSIVQPAESAGTLCRYADTPLCLVSYSAATPPGGVEAQVVILPDADLEEAYAGLDVSGKIILTGLHSIQVEDQARQHGALGIVSDSTIPPWLATMPPVREPADAPDLVMWSTFSGRREGPGLWGFNLSPRQGQRLRRLVERSSAPVVLRAEVDSQLFEGAAELVNAYLPGADPQAGEIWVAAHSSEPGAVDNASGCCLGVEVARTLKTLVERGVLPPPRRGIRFLNALEFYGYFPYVAGHPVETARAAGGLCIDSVGQDFRAWGGRFQVDLCPEENASALDSLLVHLFQVVANLPTRRFTADNYESFPWVAHPFEPGSDNILSRCFFDIPMPIFMGWPERFYHSSLDTPASLSEQTLHRAGLIAAAYLYLAASAGPQEGLWIASLAVQDWQTRIAQALASDTLHPAPTPDVKSDSRRISGLARHLGFQASDALQHIRAFAPRDAGYMQALDMMAAGLRSYADEEARRAIALLVAQTGSLTPELPAAPTIHQDLATRKILQKVYRCSKYLDRPLAAQDFSPDRREGFDMLSQQNPGMQRVYSWLNGRRSLGEVWERLQYGGKTPFGALCALIALLQEEGLVEEAHPLVFQVDELG